jgi:kinesin family protein 2/24
MHVDSRSTSFKPSASTTPKGNGDGNGDKNGSDLIMTELDRMSKGLCSADPQPDSAQAPFKERLRAGMVVSWDPPAGEPGVHKLDGRNLAILLSAEGEGKYRCGMVAPSLLPGSFEVFVWQQFVAAVDRMLAEVVIEYDVGTRYYYEVI